MRLCIEKFFKHKYFKLAQWHFDLGVWWAVRNIIKYHLRAIPIEAH